MHVNVRFQGIIADMLGRKSGQVELPESATVEDLLAALTSEDETARAVLKQTRAFINGKQAEKSAALADGVEVLFMRPIAGGGSPPAMGRAHHVSTDDARSFQPTESSSRKAKHSRPVPTLENVLPVQ